MPNICAYGAETIASRADWDALVIMLGTNSFAGADAEGKPETAAKDGSGSSQRRRYAPHCRRRGCRPDAAHETSQKMKTGG
jgi:hypothetical protein